jgi:hypothetical protein
MAVCKRCGSDIQWIKTTKGWLPHNGDDGALHFEYCNKKPKANSVTERSAGWITGKDYKPVECSCCPPWEVCEHSFEWLLDAEYDAMSLAASRL